MLGWELSVGLPPTADTPRLAALAEELGYARVWIFDSAPLWEDTFVHLALVAERTERIGLATAVLIPTQRSPIAMASGIATIARLAPGRLRVAFGTGYTAQLCIGQPPLSLAALGRYVRQVRGLLDGGTVEIDGRAARMMHVESITAPRPIPVEIWLSAFGPKGQQLARDIADGVIGPSVDGMPAAAMSHGTVLDPGEEFGSPRSLAAAAPYLLYDYHAAYEQGPAKVDALPGGAAWRAAVTDRAAARPDADHLLVHEGHVTHVNDLDREYLLPHLVTYGSNRSLTGTAEQVSAKLQAMVRRGWREIIYTPAGPDVAREMRALRDASRAR
jgi:5,10-methylenetetrahydromethanopterin reductase